MPRKVHNSAVELASPLFRRKRKRGNTGTRSSAGLKLFSIVGRRYSAGSSRRFSPFFSDRFERRGLVYVGADINNPAQTQATNGSGYWQSHGSADWEPTLSVANGQPISQTDALNNTTSYTYNSYGKVLTVTDAESNVTSYTYNLLGQMTSLTDPEGNATSWTYDSMGRVVSETNEKNAVRSYEYDDLGRLIQTTDRNGRVIQYEYDYLGCQTAEKWLDSNNAVIGSIEYTFDGNNNLLTVTDSISGTDYEYRYDALNRCVYTCIDAAELNSPVYLSYLYNDSALTVTETLTGLINGIVAPYYQNVYQFDVFGRLESISQTGTGLTAKSVDYVYNLNGQRISAEYQQNGDTVSESAWVYDVAGKVSSIQHKTASDAVFAEYDFTWDAGNRITEFETVDGTAEYTYDKTGQLTGADYDYITDELYTYDSNGNRTNAGYVTGENNETLSDGVYRYSYDNEGNRTEKFLWTDTNNDGIIDASEKTLVQTYEWDYRNRLSSVTNYENGIAKEVIDYLYDYLNLMIERTVTDAATSILQSSEYNLYSNGQVVLEYDTTSSVDVVKSINLWGANIDELAAVEQFAQSVNDNNVILYSYSDHLNSIRDVVLYDSIIQTAAVVNHLIYNAFGVLVSSTDGNSVNPASISPLLNYRYTGKYFDDSTGLQNNINRWYDNTTGKWLSVDPIGFKGGDVNLYRYVRNQSNSSFDYRGLWLDMGNNIWQCENANETFESLVSTVNPELDPKLNQFCVKPIVKDKPQKLCENMKEAWELGKPAKDGQYDFSNLIVKNNNKLIISVGSDSKQSLLPMQKYIGLFVNTAIGKPNEIINGWLVYNNLSGFNKLINLNKADIQLFNKQKNNLLTYKEKCNARPSSMTPDQYIYKKRQYQNKIINFNKSFKPVMISITGTGNPLVMIKHFSNEGRNPISELYIIGHANPDKSSIGSYDPRDFRIYGQDLLGSDIAQKREWKDAIRGIMPPIGYLTPNAKIYFVGCTTQKVAESAKVVLRGSGSQVFGTTKIIKYDIFPDNGVIRVGVYIDEPENRVFSFENLLNIQGVWVHFNGRVNPSKNNCRQ